MENKEVKIAWFEKVGTKSFGVNYLKSIDNEGMTNLIETPCIRSGFYQYEINSIHDDVNICTGESVFSVNPPIDIYCKKLFDYYNMSRLPVSEWGIGDNIYPVSYEPSSGNFYIEIFLNEKFVNPINFSFDRGKDLLYSEKNKRIIAEEFYKRINDLPLINCKRPVSYRFINDTMSEVEKCKISQQYRFLDISDVYNYRDKFIFREIDIDSDETEYVIMYTDTKSLKSVYLHTDINNEHSVPFLKYTCEQLSDKSVASNIPFLSNGYSSHIKQIY